VKRVWYRLFRSTSSFQYRFGRRFTRGGTLVLGALGAAAAIGFDTNRTVGYQAFSFLLALLLIALAWSRPFRGRLTVRRVLPRFVTAGEPARYRLVIENGTARPQRGLVLLENLADPRPSFEEFTSAREPGEERRNWFDRTVGYPRWEWLVARRQGARIAAQPLPPLPPGAAGEVRVELTPRRRGRLDFTGVTIARPDPLGLVNALQTLALPQSLLVLPKRYAMPDFPLPGTRKYQPGGVALASSVGDSEEFVALRDYRPGDPVRRIHWKSLARAGRPVVKEYQDEFFVRHALVLDTFAEREPSDAFEEAVSVAASIACSVRTQDALLDLLFVGPEAYGFTAGRGLGNTDRMLEVLAGVRACRDRPFRALHHAVLERHASLSGAICVFLAWDRPRQELIAQLRALGTPARVFVVTEKDASVPARPGEVHHLVAGAIAEGLARG
jgi:uncharacterized protein (DUF58 family)